MAQVQIGNIATGTVEGTGAAINVSVGFVPHYVKVFNYDDAGGLAPTLEWWYGMGAGDALKTLKVVDSGTSGNASSALITSNGIDAYAGTDTTGAGFTIGADTDVNVSNETIYWVAIR